MDAAAPALTPGTPRVAVLFACTGNSARSPVAEALLRHHTADAVEVTSAGSRPKPRMHPNAVRVLREEYGIDISDQHPRHLDSVTDRRFDHVITLCDKVREVCPEFSRQPWLAHWSIPDPAAAGGHADTSYPAFQRTVADIDARIRYLLPVLAHTRLEAQP
jgi:ArsR family transcriptional regulator, arsenate/arsenite/antimonite-responsive transcriptional repressor / arsenate reductase (thioredoxin)